VKALEPEESTMLKMLCSIALHGKQFNNDTENLQEE
jgi:hypothetical protein